MEFRFFFVPPQFLCAPLPPPLPYNNYHFQAGRLLEIGELPDPFLAYRSPRRQPTLSYHGTLPALLTKNVKPPMRDKIKTQEELKPREVLSQQVLPKDNIKPPPSRTKLEKKENGPKLSEGKENSLPRVAKCTSATLSIQNWGKKRDVLSESEKVLASEALHGSYHGKPCNVADSSDVYYQFRRDPIILQRAAAKHDRQAKSAFSRGDHTRAKQKSELAREEWAQFEELNKRAAEQIEQVKNAEHNIWTIDLHGLHRSEVAHALENRIMQLQSFATENQSSRKILHVITGKGIHSKGGEASLPAQVEYFCLEKRYNFEGRPGVIDVDLNSNARMGHNQMGPVKWSLADAIEAATRTSHQKKKFKI